MYKITDECVACGTCLDECPNEAIKEGANYDLALWVAYYNFLRPHKQHRFQPPVRNDVIANGENMPGKWQLLIFLGQQTIKKMQETAA